MENLALISSKFPVLVGAPNPSEIPSWPHPFLPLPAASARGGTAGGRRPRFVASALRRGGDGASQRIPRADQIGLTPEEVISKIMANPEVTMAFQNPKVQAAIMDCSQNPLSIAKYQNDKEVMDVFTKISELFPGVTGYP